MTALSATAKHEYYAELDKSLPPPVLARRKTTSAASTTAIETFEALRPGDAYEARLAVKIVLCGAHAVDSLREAGLHRDDFAKLTRCRAQAASMARAEGTAKRTLEREQKLRLAVEAVAGTAPAQPAANAASPPSAPVAQAAMQPRAAGAPAAPPPDQAASAPPPSPEAIARPRPLRTRTSWPQRRSAGTAASPRKARRFPPPDAAHRSGSDRRAGPRRERCAHRAGRRRRRDAGCGRLTGPARKQRRPSHESGL